MWGAVGMFLVGFATFLLGYRRGYIKAQEDMVKELDRMAAIDERITSMLGELQNNLDEVKGMRDRVSETLRRLAALEEEMRGVRDG